MAANGAVIVLDPKGGRTLLLRAAAEAQRLGKPFALFAPAFAPYASHSLPCLATMNPLATATDALEVGQRLQALMPTTREEVFRDFPLALLIRLAEAQQALGIPWTLEGLYRVSVIRRRMEALIYQYLVHLGYYRPGGLLDVIEEYYKQGGDDLTADALIEDAKWPAEHYRKMTTSLVPTFRGVVGGTIGPLLSPPPGTGLTWERIVQEGMVVYFALASMLIGDVANRIGRIVLQDLAGYIGARFAYHDLATLPPITVILDDAAALLYPQFIDVLNKSREANVRFILAMQSRADPDAMIGEAFARQVYDNLGTRIICGLSDEQTALDLTRGLQGPVALPEGQRVSVHYGGVGGLSGSTGTGLRHEQMPLIRPAWLTALPIGEAFARVAGIWWKLRIPLLSPVPQALRDTLGLTALWEALDPNRQKGDLCDPSPHSSVPPEPSRLSPSPPAWPSLAATPRASKLTSRPSWSFSQALRRAGRFVSAMVPQRPRR